MEPILAHSLNRPCGILVAYIFNWVTGLIHAIGYFYLIDGFLCSFIFPSIYSFKEGLELT